MTAMPEAKLAREAEISYALIALVTDYDCWKRPPVGKPGPQMPAPGNAGVEKPSPAALLEEIIANLRAASDNGIALIQRVLARIASDSGALAPSPAHDALKLAIWSDKSRIPAEEVQRLAPLWMKYFDAPGGAAPAQ
jgi:5'-methylthioadenosine phosphorylase